MGFVVFLVAVGLLVYWHLRFKALADKFEQLEKDVAGIQRKLAVSSIVSADLKKAPPPVADTVEKIAPAPETSAGLYSSANIPPASGMPPPMPPLTRPPESRPLPSPALSSIPPEEKSTVQTSSDMDAAEKKKTSVPRMEFAPPEPSAIEKTWRQFKENVDWEQFTGVKLFAWLGGLALFIGAVFFVKYSIDNNLIPAQLRLAIGAGVGLLMIVSSLIIDRDRYKTTTHTMAAGGIAVLYAVSFTATVYYGFLPKPVGFGLVALISAAAFVLAVFHQGRFISVLGAIGAYVTPLLIQTGHPNLTALFLYLTVINIGLFEVIRRTSWMPLSVLVTIGTLLTLAAGAWGTRPPAEPYLITIITVANLIVFCIFFLIYRGQNAASRSMIWSLRILFISVLLVATVLIPSADDFPFLPLALIAAATLAAGILAYAEKSWSEGFIFYAVTGFLLLGVWSYLKFDLSKPSWEMLLFLIYGVIAGLGPVFVIRRHGLNTASRYWLKIFPAALAAVAVVIFLKSEMTSFFFWPMLLGVGGIGLFISLLIGSMLSAAVLILLILAGGVHWILKTPVLAIGNEFFLFLMAAGLIFCFLTVLLIKKISSWKLWPESDTPTENFAPAFDLSSAWITALPVLGPFLLLTLVLMRQHPVAPHPAMATALCFFAVAVFLARYFKSQEILTVALSALAITLLSWGLRHYADADVAWPLLGWSFPLWLAAVAAPSVFFRPEKDWKIGWCAWAVFELILSCLVVLAVDRIWERDIAGWIPLALAVLKLPVVILLLKRLEGEAHRNAILAFHGGVLLFYVSSISVLLLGNNWMGVALVIESMLLLWLNRRIEHPGLRWVALGLAPVGLSLLLTDINTLKSAHDLPVFNPAVLSCALCVVALSLAVRWAGYPREKLAGNFSLPQYFLWLAIGSGFFLVNMMVSDIFGGTGGGFRLDFYAHLNQYISHTLVVSAFGFLMLRIRLLPSGFKVAGLILLLAGVGMSFFAPFYFRLHVGTMMPLFNSALILFAPGIAALIYLSVTQTDEHWGGATLKNVLMALGIALGLLALNVELSTVFQNNRPFDLILGHSSAMALAVIFSWFVFGLVLVLWPRPLAGAFRLVGTLLMVVSLARAVAYPLSYARDFGAVTPIFNIPTGIFLLLVAGLVLLTLRRFEHEWSWREAVQPRHLWGALLILFALSLTNVQVASVFGMFNSGADSGYFTFHTHGRLSQQLAYSISWLVFAIVLLLIGIRWKLILIRWVALALFVITALKVFIKDLWTLGQLYRVFSFIGLAVTLILVSFLYQRYLGGGKKTNGEKE